MADPITHNDALSAAYSSLRAKLLRLLTYKTGSAEVAEDLLHEVFRKALAARQAKQLPSNLAGWLYTITKNTLTDYYRSQRPSVELPEDLAGDDVAEGSAMLSPCLLPFIRQLPDIYQIVLIAADIDERPLQSIADEQGVSLSAIKSRVSRGRQQLKRLLLSCCEITLHRSGAVEDYKPKQSDSDCCP